MSDATWKKCSCCKKDIPLRGKYYSCSISSCRKSVFCSVECWDVHNNISGHKSAWAEESIAPATCDEPEAPRRVIVSKNEEETLENIPEDILIVASKLKQYVKVRHDLSTSASVMDVLSSIVREICDEAANHAKADGRKTLMDRDFSCKHFKS